MLASPYYSFFKFDDGDNSIYYQFTTSNGIIYIVYFNIDEYDIHVKDFPLLLHEGYSFGFKPVKFTSNEKNVLDNKVLPTIYHIVLDFLDASGPETILLYHCDPADGKQAYRSKLFDKWEKTISSENRICKHSLEVQIDNTEGNPPIHYYIGFITLANNPHMDDIKTEFESFSIILTQPK